VIARFVCGAVGAALALLVWIITGFTDSFAAAAVIALVVGIVCFIIGPPVVEALSGIELDGDDW
jgi:preprotein translocase subunit SecF